MVSSGHGPPAGKRTALVIVRTSASEQRARASLQRQVSGAPASWERKCWHLGTRRFACEADARAALERELKGKPMWLEIDYEIVAHAHHAGKGRPRKEASPTTYQWQIVATVTVNQQRVDEEALRKACFIVGTNELEREALSDQELVTTYKEQGGVERGFRFLRISAVPGFLGLRQETGAHYRASA
jgi:transposase